MIEPTKIVSETEAFRDRNRQAIIHAKVQTPDGGEHVWTYSRTPDGVIVLAIDAEGRLAVKREWRIGRQDFAWELPSGWAGDLANPADPIEAANRELREETGYAGELRVIGSFFLSNHATTKFYVVLAKNLTHAPLPPDEGEHVECEFLPLEEARRRLLDEQVPTAQVVSALSILGRA